MIWRCFDSWVILAAFAAVYLIPPLLALRRIYPSADRITLLLLSAGLGISSQALLGFFWNHFVNHAPISEGVAYFLFWLAAGVIIQWRTIRLSTFNSPPSTFNTFSLLALLLLASISIRSFDALTHASLGQSDAYTHLQFLRDVPKYGQIRNIVYPPGYSWVLALPVMTFNLDAYLVARYVGPFFGALLVVTVYLLGRRHSQAAGLFAAFLASVCPLLYPLIKTGMGAFANQMGLFLLPLALLLYLSEAPFLFAFILLGLTVSVPLFVFTLALIVVPHRLLSCRVAELSGLCPDNSTSTTKQPNNSSTLLPKPRRWLRESLLILLPFLLAFGLAGYHFLSPGKLHLTTTATLVTGIETPGPKQHSVTDQPPGLLKTIKSHPAGKLAVDLLTVKRVGLGNNLMNLAALALAGIFTCILVAGFRSCSLTLKLLGCWGLLTTLQAATGFLEFSLYQRSGWILLEAIALAGGIILAWLHGMEKMRKVIRSAIILGLSASVLLAFWLPPQHRCITSGAEDELATVLRELSGTRLNALHARGPLSLEQLEPSTLIARAAAAPNVAIISRRYTLFNADQGNMADVLPDPKAHIRQIPVEKDTRLKPPSDHFVCLVDRFSGLPDMGLLDRISPELTQSLAGFQDLLYKPNEVILAFLAALPPQAWRITQEERGLKLSIYLVERLRP
ncbi:MAG: hypothetical protein WCI95_04545 [bacterium]